MSFCFGLSLTEELHVSKIFASAAFFISETKRRFIMETNKILKSECAGLNTTQASRYIGVSESLLRKFRQEGSGPKYCKIGSKVVYRIQDLEEFLEKSLV